MLMISRRVGEAVVINGDIEVTVLEVKGARVKLGVQFPAGSTVFRKELFLKIMEENRSAASAPAPSVPLTDILNKLPKKD